MMFYEAHRLLVAPLPHDDQDKENDDHDNFPFYYDYEKVAHRLISAALPHDEHDKFTFYYDFFYYDFFILNFLLWFYHDDHDGFSIKSENRKVFPKLVSTLNQEPTY